MSDKYQQPFRDKAGQNKFCVFRISEPDSIGAKAFADLFLVGQVGRPFFVGWVRKRTTCSSWQGCVASTYGDHKTLKNLGGEMSKGYSHRGGLKGAFIWDEIARATVLCFGTSFSARLFFDCKLKNRLPPNPPLASLCSTLYGAAFGIDLLQLAARPHT